MLPSLAVELRRHSRKALSVSVTFAARSADEPLPGAHPPRWEGVSRDISLGGIFIETESPFAFGSTITVYITLPAYGAELALAAVVRWTAPDGMGLQFGSMGAHATHAITEVTR